MHELIARSDLPKYLPRSLRRRLRGLTFLPALPIREVQALLGGREILQVAHRVGAHHFEVQHHLPGIVLSARSLANHYRSGGVVESNLVTEYNLPQNTPIHIGCGAFGVVRPLFGGQIKWFFCLPF
ncbi:unannotated protein [freshwater metagenome]|uniref:Unannotated protein n=1 Tax=freshwater metagenome TaxID=449393 RepID=A0A6J6HLQ5_9ZZZZ